MIDDRRETGRTAPDQLLTRFERLASRSPDAVALVSDDERLTYGELNQRAVHLAHHLESCGLAPNERVGISLQRSAHLISAVLGVLKAGGAYVPLDPAYPLERLSFVARDAGCVLLLHDDSAPGLTSAAQWRTLSLDSIADTAAGPVDATPPLARPDDLAYVMYTSGSSGQPKGVAVETRNVVHLVDWALDTFSTEDLRGVLASTSISFDLSVFEMFVPLSAGGTIVLVDNLLALADAPARSLVTFVNTVPSIMREFLRLNELPPSVRTVALAGEPLHPSLVDQLYQFPAVDKVFDLYGPTETTVYATYALRTRGGPATIGRPIANMRAYVLDDRRRPVPDGDDGELYLGGAGLARGYLGRKDLTDERFVPHPDATGERLYRTGDRVRWRDDGSLEFLGRLDRQVKVRGYRVELGEIESALLAYEGLKSAAVITRGDTSEDMQLVAYVVETKPCCDERLYSYLENRLPACMIPTRIIRLDDLPRLPNGKVHYASLPVEAAPSDAPRHAAVEPSTDAARALEAPLADIWRRLLRVPHVAIDDNFFDVGGNSLLAVRLFAEIERQLGFNLPPASLFRSGTIAAQARLLASRPAPEPPSPLVPLQPRGTRPPFFLVHGIGGEVFGFQDLVRHTGSDQPIYGLRAHSREERASVQELARIYIRAIRSLVPDGPYCIGGYSAGGAIAYEMAQQLLASKHAVALLLMIDASAPNPEYDGVTAAACWRWLVNALCWPFDDDFFRTSPSDQWARLRSKLKAVREFSRQAIGLKPSAKADVRDLLGLWNAPEDARAYLERYVRMMDDYRATEYEGRVTLLRARTLSLSYRGPADLGWGRLARRGVSLHVIPGAHDTILAEPRVRYLGRTLAACLLDASTTGARPAIGDVAPTARRDQRREESSVVI